MNNETEDVKYQEYKKRLLERKQMTEAKIQQEKEKYANIKESSIDQKEKRLEVAMTQISRQEHVLDSTLNRIEFSRPQNEEDISYRLRQYNEFPRKIEKLAPDDLPLRFHGCPIYTAKQIIQSGGLSSSVDRLGFESSYDTADQVSVTTKDTIRTTIKNYSSLGGDYYMPAGCVFVLLPKDKEDAKAGDSLLMRSVSFKEDPDRLFAIITTKENIDRVKEWSKENGVDTSKIHDFDGFITLLEQQKQISHTTDATVEKPHLKSTLTDLNTKVSAPILQPAPTLPKRPEIKPNIALDVKKRKKDR